VKKPRTLTIGVLSAALTAAMLMATGSPATSATDAAAASSITWSACRGAARVECGTLSVPLDWSHPRGKHIQVAVARRPADDRAHRVGTLFFNPGGPGDGATGYVIEAEKIFSAGLRTRFDLVGMDPRATGGSAKVHCDVPVLTPAGTLFPRTQAQFDALLRHNREVGSGSLRGTGPLLSHVDTVTVARDHEALRIALGEKTVTWLGLSYGTQLAANYAQLYPQRTRAMVLDAALEHSLPEVVQVADEIMSSEASFNRFAQWCTTAAACALRGQDVSAVFDRLVADAERHPIAVKGALRPVTGEDIRMGAVGLLRFKEPSVYGPDLSWAGLSRAIAAAVVGNAVAFALPPADVAQDSLSSQLAIGCMEYVPQIRTYGQMRQRITMARQLAPHLQGASETWRVNYCIGWPLAVANPPRALDVRGVPALMVHAVHDSSDPYSWAHSLAAQIRGIALLTRTGDGHTSYHTSPCARAAIDQFLIRPQAPADRVCAG
jgi:pimeloyl-ACP methyl ester carboxylesterase